MSLRRLTWVLALTAAFSGSARAEPVSAGSNRTTTLEFKLGGYLPLIDREPSLTSKPYETVFGGSSMLLFEVEADRILWQKFGTLGIGVSAGYAEKYGRALITQGPSAGQPANDSTALKVVPLRALAVYRLEYGALKMGIPLVPYAKVGFVFTPWWITKGGSVEVAEGSKGSGVKYGYMFAGGISLMLDFLEPQMAKDFTTDIGVNHSYLFAEYVYEEVNNFGKPGLDLSSRHWMFGFALDF
jgi:hypothetical protein